MVNDMVKQRLIVGVSGSSAPRLAWATLAALRVHPDVETHLVLSKGATKTIQLEMNKTRGDFEGLADVVYEPDDLGAALSSGSYLTIGMVVVPCSMKLLAEIATGTSANLLSRAAEVCLKEGRRLVLVPRESPLNLINIRNMEAVTLAGAVVLPPMPAFYHRPQTIADILAHNVGEVLDQFGIEHDLLQRWKQPVGVS